MENEKDYKYYIERHRFWSNVAIDQLSFTNNFLLTLSTGMLAFSLSEFNKNNPHLKFTIANCDYSLTFSVFSLICTLIAVLYGIIVMLSRMYDARLTREVTLIRLRYYDKEKSTLPNDDFDPPDIYERICTSIQLLLRIDPLRNKFIKSGQFKNNLHKEVIKTQLNDIKKASFFLGLITWRYTKYQVRVFILGIISYTIAIIIR